MLSMWAYPTNLSLGKEISEKTNTVKLVLETGLPRIREKSGKLNFFQGQGIVREYCEPSGKFENIGKCQEIIREFLKKKKKREMQCHIFNDFKIN